MLRILLNRDDFRRLVAGQTVFQFPESVAVEIELNLEVGENPPDPPEASEFLPYHQDARLKAQVYKIEDVAVLFGLSRNSAYVAAREDRLPVPIIKIGKRMMVSKAALDRFLEKAE